jgi:hypothetical protein
VAKRMGWLKLPNKTEPELELEPPIWLGSYGTSEHFHEQTPRERLIRKLVLERAEGDARRLGVDRREFLASMAGFATTLSVINLVSCGSSDSAELRGTGGTGGAGGSGAGVGGGAGGSGGSPSGGSGGAGAGSQDAGGYYDTGTDPLDAAEQCAIALDPQKEFIFDIQTHHVTRSSPAYDAFLQIVPQGACGKGVPGCYLRSEYIRKMFLESATTVAVLSGVPAVDAQNPLTNSEIAATRDAINMLAGSQRSVNHSMVLPNYDHARQLDGMQQIHEQLGVAAWKCYTPWGPNNSILSTPDGFWLDDASIGIPFIEKGRQLGVKVFCCHKGLPLPGFNPNYTSPRDIGVVAKAFPDCKFIVYHSAFQHGGTLPEGAYQSGSMQGTNSLVTVLSQNGIGPNQNVYAELGSTWQSVMTDPTQAAHVLGKLLRYVGEDNVVWGTDSIWYGSPQPQIEAFIRFQISDALQQQHGYPALTDAIKRKILGLNAARAYGIDASAVRCGINAGEISLLKGRLDDELGARRWALSRPVVTTRRQFLELVRFHRAANVPG